MDELEKIVNELHSLAKRKPLKGKELTKAKELMRKLREMGFTNMEISELTNNAWSEPTIKNYTRGATVKDPTPKEDTLRTLSRMINAGLTLENIKMAISIKEKLDTKGVSFEDVSVLLEEVKKSNVDIKELLQMYRDLKNSNLSIAQLREILSYKSELEKIGFTLEGLKETYQTAKTYGDMHEIMKAINTYASLKNVENEVKNIEAKKEELNKQASELNENVKKLKEEQAQIEHALKLYEELKALGFDEITLKMLKNASDKYGGVKSVIEAVNKYTKLTELESKVEELEKKKSNVESELKKTEADYVHLQPIISMCEELLYKHGFSVSAITDIYKIAKKYREPIEVIKAIEKYEELKAIEEQIETLTAKKNELKTRVDELNNKAQELRALIKEQKQAARGLLKPFATEISKTIDLLGKKSSETIDAIAGKYDEYAKKYGELKAESGKFEEELRFARIIRSLINYSSECKELPLDYDIYMLRAIINHCKIKGVNPKVKAGEEIRTKYKYYGDVFEKTELLDLLQWALRGLESSLGSTSGEKHEP
jgi:chromosome segregation ATPase/Fe2+ transport system protein FeoA